MLAIKESDSEYHVKAEPVDISRLCPHCGELQRVQKHGSRSTFIRDLPTHGKTMMIHLEVPRLICLVCRKTFMAVISEVDTDRAMTERLVRWMGRQSLEYNFAEMAKQVGVDEKTVRNVFDAYVAQLEKEFKRETPVWLGVDEIKLGRFRAIFTNISERTHTVGTFGLRRLLGVNPQLFPDTRFNLGGGLTWHKSSVITKCRLPTAGAAPCFSTRAAKSNTTARGSAPFVARHVAAFLLWMTII